MADDDEATWGLVMPFVATESHGGPYDDDSFVAGWEAGWLDQSLDVAARVGHVRIERVVHAGLLDQLDLIAMQYGYKMTVGSPADGWVRVTFDRS